MPEATEQVLLEQARVIEPPPEFRAQAIVRDPKVYEEAEKDWEAFWARVAQEFVTWFRPFDRVLEWTPPAPGTRPPWIRWFIGGRLN
ncbi:MAG: acetyl-coenzyme A synthetase, partial [Acidobacteria bacterium]|nr:acetyl-coenzyme A synthetase [Acidobacteriota bacterium]